MFASLQSRSQSFQAAPHVLKLYATRLVMTCFNHQKVNFANHSIFQCRFEDSIINYAYVWSKCDACAPPYASCTKLRTSSNNVYRPMLNTLRPWLVQDQNATGQFDNCTTKPCKEV